MSDQSTLPAPHANPHKQLLEWILAHFSTISFAVGFIVYASGFLVIFMFHDSYRLHGVDVDLFKARFFQVGIMFTALLLNIVFPIAAILAYTRYHDREPKWVINPIGISAFALMTFVSLVVLFFAPPGTFRSWNTQAWFATAIALPAGLGWFFRRLRIKGKRIPLRNQTGVVVNIVLLFCLGSILRPFYSRLLPVIWPAGIWFFIFAALMAFILYLSVVLGDEERQLHEQRLRLGFCIVIIAFLFFFEINVFALGIYQYIPAAKGGGDFTEGRVVLRLQRDAAITIPLYLIATESNDGVVTKPLVLVEETSSSLYVADPDANGGKSHWHLGGTNRPSVFEIKHDAKLSIEHRDAQ